MLGNLWSEFKSFAFKGNMIELAVAVVIGAAFGNVIHAMVTDIINPAISYAVTGVQKVRDTATEAAHDVVAKVGATTQPATTQSTTAPSDTHPPVAIVSPPVVAQPIVTPVASDPQKAVNFDWTLGRFPVGHFVGEIINFMIVAFAVFLLIVKLTGSVMKRVGGTPSPSEPTTKECSECLSVIPLKARRCPNCTSVLAPS